MSARDGSDGRELARRIVALRPFARVALERRLWSALDGAAAARVLPRPPGREELPLSFAQERLWFLEQLIPGSPLYNLPAAWGLTGPIDVSALTRAVTELVRRHESLRTIFGERDGLAFQRVQPAAPADVRVLEAPAGSPEAQQLISDESMAPFDLRRGPVCRVSLLRHDPQRATLLVTVHHIVSDGWSMDVLIRELWTLYEAARAGTAPPLLEPVLQYGDFAVWQRAWLSGGRIEAQLDYWRQQLADAPHQFTLPPARPRPAVQGHVGRAVPVAIPADVAAGMREVGRREGATMFMVLAAGLAVVLGRHAGERDVVVGTPIANRTRTELEPLIGFFVNTLVLRLQIDENLGFGEAVRRAREAALGAYAHQDVPFEQVVETLRPQRDLSQNPLFQIMLVLQHGGTAAHGEGEAPHEGERPAKFDLTLSLRETGGGLVGCLEYNVDLYDGPYVAQVAGHLRTLLERAIQAPARPLRELEMLGGDERQALAMLASGGAGVAGEGRGIHHLLDEAAAAHGARLAVEGAGVRWTYDELRRRAADLAARIAELGLAPEARVAVVAERSPELVVALFGVLRAGAVYVPIDPRIPEERASFIAGDAGVAAVVGPLELRAVAQRVAAAAGGVPLIEFDRAAMVADAGPVAPARPVDPDRLAYVIYTSGSTGRPKGAAIAHRGAVNMAEAQRAEFGVTAEDRVLLLASPAFDASLFELLLGVGAGAALCCWPADDLVPGLAMTARLVADAVSVLVAVPSVLRELDPTGLNGLRTVISVAEACSEDLVAAWAPGRRMFNAYGPTEASCWTVATALTGGPVAIGRPVAGVTAYVLDEHLQLLPRGAVGELYLGGVAVGRGYHGRAALTAERFVPDAFAAQPGARLYRTGDRVRWRADGALDYLGRADDQVKLRGFRIELREIEAVMAEHPGVREAAVVVRHQPDRLVGFFVARDDTTISGDELRGWLRRHLLDAMVPSTLVALDRLPRLASGKVDRRALPEVMRETRAGEAPSTPAERLLAALWSEILGVEVGVIGVDDNFFELGGQSLLATRLVSRARGSGFRFSLRDVFEQATLRALAALGVDEVPGTCDEGITVLDRRGLRIERAALDPARTDVADAL